MTGPELIERASGAFVDAHTGTHGLTFAAMPDLAKEWYREGMRAAIATLLAATREPTTEMLRALIRWRGYDPDAHENTLDLLGQLDIATIGNFVEAWRVMHDALASELGCGDG